MPEFPSPDQLRRKVESISGIATLPHVMARILQVIDDEHSSAADLSAEIAADTSLTAKILKIVNSAFYGFPRAIGRIGDAVVILGYQEIQRISLATSVIGMFGADPGERDRRLRFWRHSFHTGAMAELLERQKGRGAQGVFAAGILHDLGRVVLDQHFPGIFHAVTEAEAAWQQPACDVEERLLGTTHAHIGHWLAERWNLPPTLSEAIRFHHTPDRAPDNTCAAAVHVADALVHRINDADRDDVVRRRISVQAIDILRLDVGELPRLEQNFRDRVQVDDILLADLIEP